MSRAAGTPPLAVRELAGETGEAKPAFPPHVADILVREKPLARGLSAQPDPS